MAKYQTTFGRPRNFKIGSVDIKIGKHPVEIPDEFARKILKDYPGWIVLVSGSKLPEEENAETETDELEIIPSDADIITENADSVTENAEPVTGKAPKKTTKKAAK